MGSLQSKCDIRIRIRSQFSFTERQNHTDGVRHSQLSNTNALKNVSKLTTIFKTKTDDNNSLPKTTTPPKKRPKTMFCQGFLIKKTQTCLHVYAKYKNSDHMSDSTQILCNNGK